MGIFDKVRNNLRNETYSNSEPTGWENMTGQPEKPVDNPEVEQKKVRRQREKLIGALLPGSGNPNLNAIAGEPNLGPHDENIVLAKISQNLIGAEDFTKVIDGIKGPMTNSYGEFDERAATASLDKMLTDNHQLKILAFANDFSPNDHYQKTDVADIQDVLENFSNPMQFEAKMRPFMTFLAEHNSPKKVAEYEAALDSLEQTLYGKKYEYFKRSKELVMDSQRIFGTPIKSPLELPDIQPPAEPRAERGMQAEPVAQSEQFARNAERERNHESLIKSGSEYQMSRAQVANGQFARLGELVPADESCEDAKVVDLENNFLAVFDGVGGHAGGSIASRTAANAFDRILKEHGPANSPTDLSDWIDAVSQEVANTNGAGNTTATLAQIAERPDGGKALYYAQVGDSRLYIIHPNGVAEQITKDEGYEKYITNALGMDNRERVCMQAGYRELSEGDKLVLCSDGITGDKGTDLMYEDELANIVNRAGDTAYAAQALVNSARKRDDRTAIVVEV